MAFNPTKIVSELQKAGVVNLDSKLGDVLNASSAGLDEGESADVTIMLLTKYAVVLPVTEQQ
ncbi:MAG: hypothetical protein QOK02_6641 [Mycobacterium sp.]|jgi:hypothetical protein|nr:hypothetical protein [Mycobacterium sp.]